MQVSVKEGSNLESFVSESVAYESTRATFFMETEDDVSTTYNSTVTASVDTPLKFIEMTIAEIIDKVYIPLLTTAGILGNSLSFITFVFSSLRTSSTCVYMAVIAVLDSIILILSFCSFIRRTLGQTLYFNGSDWGCGFSFFLFYFCIHFDVLLLLALTIDRFIVVRFPFKAQSLCTPKSAVKAILVTGFFSFALNFQILFTRRLQPSGNPQDPVQCWYPDPDVNFYMVKIYTWIDASIYSFIPFASLLTLNILIIKSLRSSSKFGKQFTNRQDGKKTTHKMKIVIDNDTVHSGDYTSHTDLSTNEVDSQTPASCGRENESKEGFSKTERSHYKASATRNATAETGKSQTPNTNTNITIMLLLISFAFLVFSSPVVIFLLYMRYVWLPSTRAEMAQVRLWKVIVGSLMYTNHAINFLLYCISGRRFRKELAQLVARTCCRQRK